MSTTNSMSLQEENFGRQILLAIWFTVSFGFGILLVEQLDQIKIGGFKLGFWFAQQGQSTPSWYSFLSMCTE